MALTIPSDPPCAHEFLTHPNRTVVCRHCGYRPPPMPGYFDKDGKPIPPPQSAGCPKCYDKGTWYNGKMNQWVNCPICRSYN